MHPQARERPNPTRRKYVWLHIVVVVLTLSIALTAATAPVPFVAAPIAPPIRGADISSTLRQESAGTTVTADGAQMEVEQVLAAAGANYVRLRIWVDPPAGHSDEASALILARRARAAGLKVLINLHYSDSWADPENQAIPAAWQGQDLATLAETVRGYTQRVVSDFAAQGTPVDMVQIGNEITWGMLWPVGAVYLEHGERWQAMATLLNAGIAGVRAATPVGHSTAVMLHSERSGDAQGARHFYDSVITAGVTDFDVIGLSYYPFWHGSLATLQATLRGCLRTHEHGRRGGVRGCGVLVRVGRCRADVPTLRT